MRHRWCFALERETCGCLLQILGQGQEKCMRRQVVETERAVRMSIYSQVVGLGGCDYLAII
jgi:hypothetical protein